MSSILKNLAAQTGLSEITVHKIMHSAPERYKTYYIAKRSGGIRKISQPAREVKALQRALIDVLLKDLPIHRCAMAYRKGTSIRDNAAAHVHAGPIIKMDFKNFFPSIKKSDWIRYCKDTGCVSDDLDVELTASLLFQRQSEFPTPRLAIGAPSSPLLSNILMHEFDEKISAALEGKKICYTRYADDLTFSAPRTGYMHKIYSIVQKTIKEISYPKLRLNPEKTIYITKKYHRVVTGLTIADEGRVTIGHKKKREIRAAVHHAVMNKLDKESLQKLSGTLAFIKSAEPEFIAKLEKKYGADALRAIKRNSAYKREGKG